MLNTKSEIEKALQGWVEPYLERDLISTKCVKKIEVDGPKVWVKISLGYPAQRYVATLKQKLEDYLRKTGMFERIELDVGFEVITHAVQKNLKPLQNIKNIIAVASGKGGVGKSTVASNLALSLAGEGASVGLLDADIYGPSQPTMLGLSGNPASLDGKTMEPKVAYGIQTISIGYLIDPDTPMIWRGPMASNALQQLLNQTNWKNLDYLIVDLPPGTGDIQLTLSQQIPVSGAVIVTTPQEISLLDAQKGLRMFQKVEVPVLGIIENMSSHICSKCGHEEAIFGSGGGSAMAGADGVRFLGSLPLDMAIRSYADMGRPIVVAEPEHRVSFAYREIARKMAAELSLRKKDSRGLFPGIVVAKN